TLDGGNGSDTLAATNVANTWDLTGANAGTLNSLPFANVENLTGGTSTDLFKVEPAGSLAGLANGGTGTNTLDFSDYGSAGTVNNQTKTAPGVASYSSIGVVTGSAAAGDTLVGGNAINTWNVTGTNAGNIGGTLTFSAFENLTGGTGADTFKFS